ncbi:MAG: DUF1697 domain-containing protein [Actinomycetes bacterium]
MTTFVALLRAVNVSGQNRVPMAELRTTMAAAGYGDVRTYLQSGNIVFDAAADPDADAGAGRQAAAAQELATAVHRLIERKFGCDVRVLVLTAAELARVAVANPFLRAAGSGFDEKSLHATFLEEPAPEAAFGGLALPAQPGEQAQIAAGGRVIYLHLPHGYGRTKLNNGYFERRLGAAATTRNWRTVLALAEMSAK